MARRGSHCEMQDEDVPLMYRDQRNHIRINSDQRKHFRGVGAVLKIEVFVELFGTFSDGGTFASYPSPYDLAMKYRGRVNAWLKDRLELKGEKPRIVYKYELRVDDENLMGDVRGVYKNTSRCKSAVIRRIRRMVGPGLVIDDRTVKSRKRLLNEWKRERYREALAYFREEVRRFEEKEKLRQDSESAQASKTGHNHS